MAWHAGQAYSQDLRDRVLGASGTVRSIAARFGVSDSFVARARARQRKLGICTAGAQRNHVPARLAPIEQELLAQVACAPDQTLQQLCQWALQQHGVRVGITTMWKTLRRLRLTFKKNSCAPRSSSARM